MGGGGSVVVDEGMRLRDGGGSVVVDEGLRLRRVGGGARRMTTVLC